jgi:hypothetical protein
MTLIGANAGVLRDVLTEVAERVRRYQSTAIGEQNTKVSLIMPVLRALGWNVEDLDEVRLEFRPTPRDRPVDYALLLQRDPVLFVEAKALGENLDDRRWANQIISYAAVAGVEWVVLTNGGEYRIYNSHAPVPVDEKLFRSIRLLDDLDAAVEGLSLLSKEEMRRKSLAELWRAYAINSRVDAAVKALFTPEPDRWLVRRLARELDGISQADIRTALIRARPRLDFPVSEPPPGVNEDSSRGEPTASGSGHERRAPSRDVPRASTAVAVTVRDLLAARLLRPGTMLRKRYLGEELVAEIDADGSVRFQGRSYSSLSIAAGAARVSVKGKPPDGRRYYQTNGWTWWEFKDDAGRWKPVDALRQQLLANRPANHSGARA